jgi:hypothetical protein
MAESMSKEVYFLNQVANQKYNKDFAVNMVQLNNTVKSLSKYLIVMQKGIDDLNRDILEIVRDLIEEIFVIFNGGDLSSLDFEWGDLKYVLQAIGAFFGFPIWSGSGDVWSPMEMAQNFFENFIRGLIDFFSNLFGLDGLIKNSFLPKIPVGKLTNEVVNLIDEGAFDSSPGGAASGTWYWSPIGGVSGSGSAALDSGSGLEPLFSNPVSVSDGDELEVSVKARGGTVKIVALAYGEGEEPILRQESASIVGTGSFVSGSMTFVAPANTHLLVFSIEPASFSGSTLFIDDWESVRNVDTIPDSWVSGLPDFIQQILSLFGVTHLVDLLTSGKLIDGFAPKIVQDAIDGIWNGFANLGEMLDFNNLRTVVPDVVANLLGMNLNTQSSVSTIEAELRLLRSEGNTISDNFDRGASSSIGSDYNLFQAWAGGSGDIGTNGRGDCVWSTSGGSTRGLMYRRLAVPGGAAAQLTTDSCISSIVLASDPPNAGSPGAFTYACFSVSGSSEVSYGRLRIGRTQVVIEAVVSGVVTELQSFAINPRAGNIIEIQRGESGNTQMNKYVVRQNGQVAGTYTDPSSRIKSGSGFRGTGIGMQASSREIVPVLLYQQWLPAGAAVISCREVL